PTESENAAIGFDSAVHINPHAARPACAPIGQVGQTNCRQHRRWVSHVHGIRFSTRVYNSKGLQPGTKANRMRRPMMGAKQLSLPPPTSRTSDNAVSAANRRGRRASAELLCSVAPGTSTDLPPAHLFLEKGLSSQPPREFSSYAPEADNQLD